VFRSTDGGSGWTAVDSGLTTLDVRSLIATGTTLLAGTFGGGVFRSTDGGTFWSRADSGISQYAYVSTLAKYGSNVFEGSDGVFLSTDEGKSWTEVDEGLTKSSLWALAVSGTDLIAGSFGEGVWRRPLSELVTSVADASADVPARFFLDQNYPNPFNPTTTISFTLPAKSFVTMNVFDLLGREVATLVSGELGAGRYTRRWDVAGVASGVYFYRLQARLLGDAAVQSFVETKKLMVIK
jgi:hypothetical protein